MSESPQRLKRLIIDSATGQFLAPGGKWTPNEGEALDFSNIMSAIAACGTLRIKKTAQVLVRFGEEEGFDIRLPLREEGGRGDAMERTNAQCVTLFRDGTGHFVMGSGSSLFHSLPELSRFVGEIAAHSVVAVADARLTPTETANASEHGSLKDLP